MHKDPRLIVMWKYTNYENLGWTFVSIKKGEEGGRKGVTKVIILDQLGQICNFPPKFHGKEITFCKTHLLVP